MKRFFLLLMLIPALLSGCSLQPLPGMELSRRLIIEAIGIDASPTGTTLTMLAIDPTPQQTENEAQEKWKIYSFTANSVAAAADLAERATGKIPFFAYAKILLFGGETAKKGLSPYLDFFLRNRTVRNAIQVCVASGTANELLKTKLESSDSPATVIERLLRTGAEEGQCAASPFFQFVNRMLSPDTEAFCPLISAQLLGNDTPARLRCDETAVFEGDAFHFTMNGNDTATFLLFNGKTKDRLMCVTTDAGVFDCRLQRINPRIRVTGDTATLSIRARATIIQGTNQISVPASKKDRQIALSALQTVLKTSMEDFIEAIYKKNRTDLFRLRKMSGRSTNVPTEALRFFCTVEIMK